MSSCDLQEPGYENPYLLTIVRQIKVGQLRVIEVGMEPLGAFEVPYRNFIAGIPAQPGYRVL